MILTVCTLEIELKNNTTWFIMAPKSFGSLQNKIL